MAKKNGQVPSVKIKGWKVGERIGGIGGAFLAVSEHDSVPFLFERMAADSRGKERAIVQRLDTGEVGMLPDWGLLRVKLEDAKPTKGAAFLLTTNGKTAMKKGKWKGKKAINLTLDRLVKA